MPLASIRLTVPADAAVGDTIQVTTAKGDFPIAVGPDMPAGKEMILRVPSEEEGADDEVLDGKILRLKRARERSAEAGEGGTSNTATSKPEAEEEGDIIKVLKVVLPSGAKFGDTISILTQAGEFELQVPKNPKGKTLEVEVPVPANSDPAERLIVKRMLLNGEDVAKRVVEAPIKAKFDRKASFELKKKAAKGVVEAGFRSVMVPMPPGAVEGDTLGVMTEVGMLPVVVPKGARKAFEAKLPVPDDCQLPTLTVAFATNLFVKSNATALAAEEAGRDEADAAAPSSLSATAAASGHAMLPPAAAIELGATSVDGSAATAAANVAAPSAAASAAQSTPPTAPEHLTKDQLTEAVREVVGRSWHDLSSLSRLTVRQDVEELIGVPAGALSARGHELNGIVDELLAKAAKEIEDAEAAREAEDYVAQMRALRATGSPTKAVVNGKAPPPPPSPLTCLESLCRCLEPPTTRSAAAAVAAPLV